MIYTCRHCSAPLGDEFIDLGHQPPSNAYLATSRLDEAEVTFPLKVYVCQECWLAQVPAHTAASDLFTPDYAYFSSTSRSWLAHAEAYVDAMTERFGLRPGSTVGEIASNDGYLLQFAKARGLRVLGVEPTASTAAAARAKGIETLEVFLGEATGRDIAASHGQIDLMPANNVLAHVPDINDFVRGVRVLLAPQGVATFEFPHVLSQLEGRQFDTIYHEHFSYLSLTSVQRILGEAGLRVFDVEELTTHGGSLRVFACQAGANHADSPNVAAFLARETAGGIRDRATYVALAAAAERIKDDLLTFLIEEKRAGRRVAAYGAAAKGNTLLNYAGLRRDLLPFVCDAAESKQGKFMPGSHIPILPPSALAEFRPHSVLILPWNIADEIVGSMAHVREWGGQFVTAIPELRTL